MKIMIVVGARPNFMKAAPVVFAIYDHNARLAALPMELQATPVDQIQLVLVHTGQHYDEAMSGSFFSDLGLPKPDVHLEVGSGSHAVQTAEIMRRFEAVVIAEKPDFVVVFGDVNSTAACALVTSKISLDSNGQRPLIAHVEAGLRSFDRAMPEEINRVITDHLSDLLFVTEESGQENLCREGIMLQKIHFVGNTMIDSLLASREKAARSTVLEQFGLRSHPNGSKHSIRRYTLLTLHRPSNVDNRDTFLNILEGLEELASSCPILFSAHPRTRKRIAEFGLERFFSAGRDSGVRLLDPLGYLDFLCLMKHAALVVTDSGGIQEETTCLMVPCVTVRENTERPVTVTCGTNVIAGTESANIRRAVKEQLGYQKQGRVPEKWDGQAAGRIVEVIVRVFCERRSVRDSLSDISGAITTQTASARR
jgi:UDP-N-acetylglucosamine 2-epimerase (non-hydrolysing)